MSPMFQFNLYLPIIPHYPFLPAIMLFPCIYP